MPSPNENEIYFFKKNRIIEDNETCNIYAFYKTKTDEYPALYSCENGKKIKNFDYQFKAYDNFDLEYYYYMFNWF